MSAETLTKTTAPPALKHGVFDGLAKQYAQYRPAYAPSVLNALAGLLEKPFSEIDFVDVGAGTGIWTRMVASRGCKSIIAIEPSDQMRAEGEATASNFQIQWQSGTGEHTGLPSRSADVLSMASSFHWVDFEAATKEFSRVLRPGGYFVALWNPRLIEVSPLLTAIEDRLYELAPHIQRVSSGRTQFTEQLTQSLWNSPYFDDVVYLEGRHTVQLSPQAYLGAWRSVNDIQVQAGPAVFEQFLSDVEERVANLTSIETTYLTRAWAARTVSTT